jgi:surfactin synthase thioesterase subunit
VTGIVLYSFPYAGGGARVFTPLAEQAPSHLTVRAVEAPGRGARLREPLITDYDELVESLAGYLIADFLRRPPGTRYATLGHSAGAVLAVAVSRSMAGALGQPPVRCFLAAAEAPHLTPHAGARSPSDGELLATLAGYGVTTPQMLAEPLFVQHILPILRADLGIVSQYHKAGSLRVDYPFTLIAAGNDRTVAAGAVWAWSAYTVAGCRRVVLGGDHFSILHAPRELLAAVEADLTEELVV